MQRFVFSMALLCCFSVARSQKWFNPGDSWTYYVTTGWDFPNYGYHSLSVNGDTLINSQLWIKLLYTQITAPQRTFLTREDGDRVYALRSWDGQAYLAYDFGLNPGDTLHYVPNGPGYEVLSTDSVWAAGAQRRIQIVRLLNSSLTWRLIEGIGLVGTEDSTLRVCSFLLLREQFCASAVDGPDFKFSCFGNSKGSVYDPFDLQACQSVATHSPAPNPALLLWPNPVTEGLYLQTGAGTVRVQDAQGRHVLTHRCTEGVNEIPAGALPPGLYLAQWLSDDGAARSSGRFVIAH